MKGTWVARIPIALQKPIFRYRTTRMIKHILDMVEITPVRAALGIIARPISKTPSATEALTVTTVLTR